MAQREQILLTDDLDGREIPVGKGQTVTFALDGVSYEIDLANKNAAALRKALSPYVSAGRRVKTSRARNVKAAPIRTDAKTVKEWARANGYEVADRGRVRKEIREAFEAAN
jgi:hypothetical protein